MHPEFHTFDLRGRRLRYVCRGPSGQGGQDGQRGQREPTIVIDQGGGYSVEKCFLRPVPMGWRKVFDTLARTQRVLMHDRAGLGWSYEPTKPRSCSEQVKELRALLRHAQIGPPYLLVGHSLGGFNARWFAARYPQEVTGVVLVDSSHPDQWTRFGRLIPRPTSGEPTALQRLRQKPDPSGTPERIDYVTSADEVRTAGTLLDIPLIVVSRSPNAMRPPGLPDDIAAGIEQVWSELQRDLLSLSTRSVQIVATHAGHNIDEDDPQLVTEAVLKLLRETGARGSQ